MEKSKQKNGPCFWDLFFCSTLPSSRARALGLRACDSVSVLDSIAGTARDANSAGFSLHVSVINGESTLEMHPHQSREVTCDELWGVVEPHLESPQAELTIYSSTLVVQPDGTQTEIPLECSRTDEPVGEAI